MSGRLVLFLALLVFLAGCTQVSNQIGGEQINDHDEPVAPLIKKETPEKEDIQPDQHEQNKNTIPSCSDEKKFFTVSPVALDNFMGLVPLGNLAPSGHTFPTDHIYFHIERIDRSQWELGTIEVDVFAPGDVWITNIWQTHYIEDNRYDYNIFFSPCEEVSGFFIHISSLSPKLEEAFEAATGRCEEHAIEDFTYNLCEKSVRIEVKAGEIIGTAGGNEYQNALDLGVFDLRSEENKFANPGRWTERTKHIVCPVNYFTDDVRAELIKKLGSHDDSVKRTIEPICGTIAQDIPNTAQGVWFVEGTPVDTRYTYPEDPHLALVHDNINPAKAVFSVGRSIPGLETGAYYFDPSEGKVNRDFSVVSAGDVYCYDNLKDAFSRDLGTSVLLQLNGEKLKIEKNVDEKCGSGPWSFDEPVVFER